MSSIEQRLEYLEEANDALRMQNHVLATALKGLIRSLPPDMANDAVESIRKRPLISASLFTKLC